MLAVGIGALQFVLDKGQQEDWFSSNMIVWLTVIAVVMLLVFIIHELTTATPILNLRVFKERTYSAGIFLMTTLGFVLYGGLVLLPLFLQAVLGYPSVQAGIAVAPRGLGSFFSMPIVGFLTSKIDPRKLLIVGLLSGSVTLWALGSINLRSDTGTFSGRNFSRSSHGPRVRALTTVTLSMIHERKWETTSLFNFMRNMGGSLGIAAVATMLSRNAQVQYNTLGAHLTSFDPAVRRFLDQIRGAFVARGMVCLQPRRLHMSLCREWFNGRR
jgi:DHA2 family multidrug resistance protein